MSNDIKNTDKQDFSPIVRAIGSDLEQTTSKRKKVGEAKSLTIYPRLYAHNILTRRDIPPVTLSICVSLQRHILWKYL